MFERFSDLGRRVVVYAQEEARLQNHAVIASEHLLLGVLVTDSSAEGVLSATPIDLELARAAVAAYRPKASKRELRGHSPFTPDAKRALDLALRAAGDADIGPAALLGGLVGADCGATDVLRTLGIDPEVIVAAAPQPNEAEPTRPIRVRPKRRADPRDEH
jgi:ATP-dependent Clp protease ATP-binding subunit ClpA